MTDNSPRIASAADVARRLQPVVVGGDILAYSYVRELHRAYGVERTIVLAAHDIKMLSTSRFTDYRLEPNVHDPEGLYDALERVAAEVSAADPERADGLPDVLRPCETEVFDLVGQERLVNDDEGVPLVREPDSVYLQRVQKYHSQL